jgi:hypothetical protein
LVVVGAVVQGGDGIVVRADESHPEAPGPPNHWTPRHRPHDLIDQTARKGLGRLSAGAMESNTRCGTLRPPHVSPPIARLQVHDAVRGEAGARLQGLIQHGKQPFRERLLSGGRVIGEDLIQVLFRPWLLQPTSMLEATLPRHAMEPPLNPDSCTPSRLPNVIAHQQPPQVRCWIAASAREGADGPHVQRIFAEDSVDFCQ